MTLFSGHVWDHWPPALPSQQGQRGTGACPGAARRGEAALGAGAGSCLAPPSAGAISSSSPVLSSSGWWGGSCQGTEVVLSSVVKSPQLANPLDTEAMKVSIPTPRGVGQAAKGWCEFTRRLGFLPLAEGRTKCVMHEERPCAISSLSALSFQAHRHIP